MNDNDVIQVLDEPKTSTALVTLGGELARTLGSDQAEATATRMAREFKEATAEIQRLALAIDDQVNRLTEAFAPLGPGHDFRLRFQHYGNNGRSADDLGDIFTDFKRTAWRILIERLGVLNVMSVANRKRFEEQLRTGDLPEIDEQAILGILLGLIRQAKDFAREAAVEVFDILRPRGHIGGAYKTNDAFRVGRRVILPWYVERRWDKGFRVNYHREQEITAIDGIFHLLDGKGVMREFRGPLSKAIEESPDGRGETAYFRFKCFKNRNLHLELKRLDLVKELNGLAAGEYVLGEEETEAASCA